MTDVERELIEHALGLQKRNGPGRYSVRWAYRNYFAAGATDAVVWSSMANKGWARSLGLRATDGFELFAVTPAGMEAADVLGYVKRSMRK